MVVAYLRCGKAHWRRRALFIIGREISVGLHLGMLLGLAVLAWGFWLGRDIQVATVVALTLLVVATLATAIGSAMPFVFRLSKVDPALVSALLLSTVMDIAGVVNYFSVAHLLLFSGQDWFRSPLRLDADDR